MAYCQNVLLGASRSPAGFPSGVEVGQVNSGTPALDLSLGVGAVGIVYQYTSVPRCTCDSSPIFWRAFVWGRKYPVALLTGPFDEC